MSTLDDLRADIGDDGGTPTFNDTQLIVILQKAARRINRKLALTSTSLEVVISASGNMTDPDPALGANAELYDIVLLQAECMVSQREYQSELRSADGGIRIKDGEQEIDTKGVGGSRGTFYNSSYSPCAELEKWIRIEKMNRIGGNGKLVW